MSTEETNSCCLCGCTAKYRCPSCDRQTCSLACVTEHKLRFDCSGRRGIAYVPISEMTIDTLAHDIALLDDAARVIESTSRAFAQRKIEASASASKRCCDERKIQLLTCPQMLSRHLRNYTSIRKSSVYWTVEWYFAREDVVLFERRWVTFPELTASRVNERLTLALALEKVFKRVADDRLSFELLRDYMPTDSETVTVLVKDLDSDAKHPCYFQCDLEQSILHNISHTKILEVTFTRIITRKRMEHPRITLMKTQNGADGTTVEDARSQNESSDKATSNMDVSCDADIGGEHKPSEKGVSCELDPACTGAGS